MEKTFTSGAYGANKRKGKKDIFKKVEAIKEKAVNYDTISIANDSDDSGEGDLLGKEILDAIAWRGDVYRARFADETEAGLCDAMDELENVTDPENNQYYGRGLAREQFDYASMQLSRLASQSARQQGYQAVIRPGRLESVIVELVFQKQRSRDLFQSKEQYRAISCSLSCCAPCY